MDGRVYAVRCSDYERADEAVDELLGLMGGAGRLASTGERIVLKPNLLRAAKPDEAVTTHPAIVGAVGRALCRQGATATIADSPGSGYRYSQSVMQHTYDECGMSQVAAHAGIALNLDLTHEVLSHPEGALIRRFEIITPVVQADAVINLCKLKTHLFTGMTGAVKNLFGVIPGLTKPGYHAKLADTRRFAGMLLDLADLIAPRLSVMDAVVAMEGDGPSSGAPRQVGWLLASTRPLALDMIAGEIIGLPSANNPLLMEARARGMEPADVREVPLEGATLDELRVPDFVQPSVRVGGAGISEPSWWEKPATRLMRGAFSARPVVAEERCVACGACVRACPVDVISLAETPHGSRPRIDDSGCIRCYCCHEMCPEDAIELRTGLLGRLFVRG
ncbi:MAG: DUF362 domain-containing protein [Armatimonadota bacterium]|jgi:uncharacterized protein (DUF362 family)/NAD-dependent dihydropyrimidine dehydrogenase PreA subunit